MSRQYVFCPPCLPNETYDKTSSGESKSALAQRTAGSFDAGTVTCVGTEDGTCLDIGIPFISVFATKA